MIKVEEEEIKLYNSEGPPNSKEPHLKAQRRIYDIVEAAGAKNMMLEKIYPNPKNLDGDPKYEWKLDVYFEYKKRKIAVEIDDRHKLTQNVIDKREFKIWFLKHKEKIELFAWPRKWVWGKTQMPDDLFLEEMHLGKYDLL